MPTVIASLLAVSCSPAGDDRSPGVHGQWERIGTWPHPDVTSFDNVAVGASSGTVAWFTRRARGEIDALAYREMRDGDGPIEIEVPTPTDRVVIPVAVGPSESGWTAVAVTRGQARGENTGLMAWDGTSNPEANVDPGEMLPRLGEIAPPESVSIGRSTSATVVTAVVDGVALTWDTANAQADWEAARPDLGLDYELVSLRVVGDGERLVLAGVDGGGHAHLWSSTNGDSWDPIPADGLPDAVGSVGLLAPLGDDRVAVGWLDDEESAPFSATAVTVQVLENDGLRVHGQIVAHGDQERVAVAGATASPDDRLVVVGAALQANGTPSPMVWVRDDDRWLPSAQAELVGRLDHELRAVGTTSDDTMVAVVTPVSHIDVEAWRWQPDD